MAKKTTMNVPDDIEDWLSWKPALGGCKDQSSYIISLIRADRCNALREELTPDRWYAYLTSLGKDPHMYDGFLNAPYTGLVEED